MTRFSANLGFLWAELDLPAAIRAAAAAGFDAVECHWPFATPPGAVRAALAQTGLSMLSLNTRPGDLAGGDFGLAAVPGREREARAAIDEALDYAAAIGCAAVHVMAGRSDGAAARATFAANLRYAARAGRGCGVEILIEPLNRCDAPGYFLASSAQARAMIETLGEPTVRLLFDCYHLQRLEGDISHSLRALLPLIGHIQFAGVPDRGPPDRGELNYAHLFALLEQWGYQRPLGAEYRPPGASEQSLGWMARLREPGPV